jgi:hypothetical protein
MCRICFRRYFPHESPLHGQPRCLLDLHKVLGEPFQHLLLQQQFIHNKR